MSSNTQIQTIQLCYWFSCKVVPESIDHIHKIEHLTNKILQHTIIAQRPG